MFYVLPTRSVLCITVFAYTISWDDTHKKVLTVYLHSIKWITYCVHTEETTYTLLLLFSHESSAYLSYVRTLILLLVVKTLRVPFLSKKHLVTLFSQDLWHSFSSSTCSSSTDCWAPAQVRDLRPLQPPLDPYSELPIE